MSKSDFVKASQLIKRKKGIWKMKGYKPVGPPNPERAKKVRELVVQAVYAIWNQKQTPATLLGIYYRVSQRILELIAVGQWPTGWKPPGKRFVDRRVNEAADPRFYDDIPKIVAANAGEYQPNPILFEE